VPLPKQSHGGPWQHLGSRTLGSRDWLHHRRPYYGRCNAKSQRSKDPHKVLKSPGDWEEKEVPRGMPRATSALLSLCGIHGRLTWQGITNLAQETVRAPRWEMGEAVLRDLWLCQCSDEHCHGPSHPSLLMGLPHPNESDEQPPASVGGQGWPWAFPKVKIPQTSDFPSLLCSPPNTYACI
jgi:hypothetical protein